MSDQALYDLVRGKYDKRKGDRHKPRKRPRRKDYRPPNKWERRKIVAWDGEGANLPSGHHIYTLLANSLNALIYNDKGLSTQQCLEFMLEYNDNTAINVIYGGSYDVNMILRDVDIRHLTELWRLHKTQWRGYVLRYMPRKYFSVKRVGSKRAFVLWDVIGFFQTSFVSACQGWLGDLPELQDIEAMKRQRSSFVNAMKEEVVQYNARECRLLVMLCESLFDAFDSVGLQLQRYDGAGAGAAALLRKHDVRRYKGSLPYLVVARSQQAYSGGRIEAPMSGNGESIPVTQYDINSAYPAAALLLPSFADVQWEVVDGNVSVDDIGIYDLVAIEYQFDDSPVYPLWFRANDGSICYPQMGKGVYWGVEAKLAYTIPGDVHVVQRVVPKFSEDIVFPFSFLRDTYAQRLELKQRGHLAHHALKLCMNSVYGKLAQQQGWRIDRQGRLHLPPFHHLPWAGWITARTRARLWRMALAANVDNIIAFATDALFVIGDCQELNRQCSTDLGALTKESYDGMTLVQPGVYFLRKGDSWYAKYRGFDKGSLDREAIVQCWEHSCTTYQATLTRFVGMGSCVGTGNWSQWQQWPSEVRELSLVPSGKRQGSLSTDMAKTFIRSNAIRNPHPGQYSRPYPLAWVDGDKGIREMVNGIDLDVYEDEVEDSYE